MERSPASVSPRPGFTRDGGRDHAQSRREHGRGGARGGAPWDVREVRGWNDLTPATFSHASSTHRSHIPSSTSFASPQGQGPSSHESRRRNAEQRAATLRADALIGAVEANRVFCTLCSKWVQLRQDSSFCAYPWVQHRGKCLKRWERRRGVEGADRREGGEERGQMGEYRHSS